MVIPEHGTSAALATEERTMSMLTVSARSFAVGLLLLTGACTDAETTTDPVVEAHIDVIRERIAANNTQDWSTWQALHTPDAVRTAPELAEPLVGAAAMRAGIEELVLTFPDYHLELVEAFGVDDRLMARIHTRGTMLGPLDINGTEVPPTGLAFEQDWVAVLTFEGDLISAIDEFHDNYGILVQLGLAP
jgi:ketosteroid isomerase-like protein